MDIGSLVANISQFTFGGGIIALIIALLFWRPRTRNMNATADSIAVETANTLVTTLRDQIADQQRQINELTEALNAEREASAQLRTDLNAVKIELDATKAELRQFKHQVDDGT